ncbi:OmpA family protein [Pontibacter sp. G13]|uniref:OmpA family protein n=1 Tax=Pontibacter sp. G13 TaxID=3074898 RepID=UPI00288B97B3|nr:OmpA family protein [Pontibacter sp. G13]WNJ18829.1 OmpA family protein [Pontibacter sp. G13]
MNHKCLIAILAIFTISLNAGVSQNNQNRWMAGMSGIFLDYQTILNGSLAEFRTFDPGVSISAHTYLNKFTNLSINTSFIPETVYPLGDGLTLGTSLLDLNAQVKLKSNGTIFREDAFFAPYIGTGFGVNAASNNYRLYVPGTFGVLLQVNEVFSFQIEGTYRMKLQEGQTQPLSYSAGFVFGIPSYENDEEPEPIEPATEEEEIRPNLASLQDSDGDGVPDRDDLCPNEKGKAMYLGCPDESESTDAEELIAAGTSESSLDISDMSGSSDQYAAPSSQDLQYLSDAMENVYFEEGSDELTFDSFAVLDTVANILGKYPNYSLQVLGHADAMGSDSKNMVLSVKRAFKVKYYLVYEKDIKMARITSDGYSSTIPVSDNETEEGRAMNRRVEFKLVPQTMTSDQYGFGS